MPLSLFGLEIGDASQNKKGYKACALSDRGNSIQWMVSGLEVAFEPSSFKNESTDRMNIALKPNPELTADLSNLEKAVLEQASAHSTELWGRKLSISDVKEKMSSLLYRSPKGYDPVFRAKIDRTGPRACMLWDSKLERRGWLEKWKGQNIDVEFEAKCIWITNREWGVVVQVRNVLVNDAAKEQSNSSSTCPFTRNKTERSI